MILLCYILIIDPGELQRTEHVEVLVITNPVNATPEILDEYRTIKRPGAVNAPFFGKFARQK